jgi:uncharacterized phage-associated protein
MRRRRALIGQRNRSQPTPSIEQRLRRIRRPCSVGKVRPMLRWNPFREGTMAKTSAHTVAKYVLFHFQEKGEPINNLKLQKLLYYIQAWHLTLFDKALFHEDIEAWVHGPVVPSVYREYKGFRWGPITVSSPVEFSAEDGKHADEVLAAYGKFNAWELERLSHSENPWKQARAGLAPDASSNAVITHESMKAYYRVNG